MLQSEYEMITNTKVYPDVYKEIIEPMYMYSCRGIDKWTFCDIVDKKKLSEIPVVPSKTYIYKHSKKILIAHLDTVQKWAEVYPVNFVPADGSYNKWLTYAEIRESRDKGDLIPE